MSAVMVFMMGKIDFFRQFDEKFIQNLRALAADNEYSYDEVWMCVCVCSCVCVCACVRVYIYMHTYAVIYSSSELVRLGH
jgi:hypothetical protein